MLSLIIPFKEIGIEFNPTEHESITMVNELMWGLENDIRNEAPVLTGALEASVKVSNMSTHILIEVGVPYAGFVHRGVPVHTRTSSTGKTFTHHGQAANPFVARAVLGKWATDFMTEYFSDFPVAPPPEGRMWVEDEDGKRREVFEEDDGEGLGDSEVR